MKLDSESHFFIAEPKSSGLGSGSTNVCSGSKRTVSACFTHGFTTLTLVQRLLDYTLESEVRLLSEATDDMQIKCY